MAPSVPRTSSLEEPHILKQALRPNSSVSDDQHASNIIIKVVPILHADPRSLGRMTAPHVSPAPCHEPLCVASLTTWDLVALSL